MGICVHKESRQVKVDSEVKTYLADAWSFTRHSATAQQDDAYATLMICFRQLLSGIRIFGGMVEVVVTPNSLRLRKVDLLKRSRVASKHNNLTLRAGVI